MLRDILCISVIVVFGISGVCQERQPPAESRVNSSDVLTKQLEATGSPTNRQGTSGDRIPCKDNPGYCFNAGSFVIRLVQVTDGAQGNYNVIRLNMKFENLTNTTLILSYHARTSNLVDEFGNTYYCCTGKGVPDTSAIGIGVNNVDNAEFKDADYQLKLLKGQTSSVTFQVWGHRAHGQDWPYFHYDVTIDEMDPNNLRRIQIQHPIHFGDFTSTWHMLRRSLETQEKH